MEEKKVNEVFEFEGTTLQVVETEEMNCKNCYFNYHKNCYHKITKCFHIIWYINTYRDKTTEKYEH